MCRSQNFHALGRALDTAHLDRQRETVEQLRTQIAFFRVHRADQDETGRMGEADAFALDHIHAHRRRVQQQINHMIIEQVHFIYIQDATIGIRQHTGVEMAFALLNRFFNIERSDHAVFGRADGQIDKADLARFETGSSSPLSWRSRTLSDQVSGRLGSSLKGESATTSISGKRTANARAAVDLPVPRSPRMRTPPIRMSMALSISARFMRSCPTMAVKG